MDDQLTVVVETKKQVLAPTVDGLDACPHGLGGGSELGRLVRGGGHDAPMDDQGFELASNGFDLG